MRKICSIITNNRRIKRKRNTRFNIKDLDLFNRIVEHILTIPSQNFSAENLSNYFTNKDDREVSKTTLYNYLEYMTKAMMIIR